MKKTAAALLFAALVVPAAPAQDPGPKSLDELVDRVVELRKEKVELEKLEAATLAEVRSRLKAFEDKLAQLEPKPVPPPEPPKPKPSDPLLTALRAAYVADAGAKKADQLKDLAELYRQAADLAGQESVTTTGQLMDRTRSAAAALKIDGLLACRKLIAAECAAALGTDPDARLTADTRAKARALFLRTHEALKGAGG